MTYSPHIALAESVVAEGFDRHERAVVALTELAQQQGVSDVLVGILADRSARRVVRERALGRVIVALERRGHPLQIPSFPRLVRLTAQDGSHCAAEVSEQACA